MTQNVRSLSEAEEIAHRAESARIVYVYDVPQLLAEATGVRELGFVELTANEEIMATKRAVTAGQLAFELAKECLREENGNKLTSADGSSDVFWSRRVAGMANIRQLAVNAYNDIHVPKEEVVRGFLGSRRIRAS